MNKEQFEYFKQVLHTENEFAWADSTQDEYDARDTWMETYE